MRSISSLVVVIGLVVATTACSDQPQPAQVVDAEFARLVEDSVAQARAYGGSDEQIQILEAALETGQITFDVYNAAVDRALRCMREAGLRVGEDDVVEYRGIMQRIYGYEARRNVELPGETDVDPCLATHSHWVEMVYQLQPSSVEANMLHFEQYRDALVECLTDAGIAVDPDMTKDEIDGAIVEALEEGADCLEATGYHG